MKNKLTKEQIENWTEEEFQEYRLYMWNSTHTEKKTLKNIPSWYMFSKKKLKEILFDNE